MSLSLDGITAICAECNYSGTLRALALHSCDIQLQGGRCEDFPACGHTDGDGCQTLPTHTSDYYRDNPALTHLGCDHNTGHCDYEEEPDEDEHESFCDECCAVHGHAKWCTQRLDAIL
jgi:hypothetical protein